MFSAIYFAADDCFQKSEQFCTSMRSIWLLEGAFLPKPSVKLGTGILSTILCNVMYKGNSLRKKNNDCNLWVSDG